VCPACFLMDAGGVDPSERWTGGIPGMVLKEELARGGMGIVYRAEQEEPRREVAVKVLKPEWAGNEGVRERFRHEAQAMATLDHPAILPVFEVGEVDGVPWFSMKLAPGGSLAGRLGRYRGEWRRIAELAAGLADALAFAHGHGLLHRDIKPGNVLFDAEDRAYLADFGVAKQLAEGESLRRAETRPDALLGTPQYLPPEALDGRPGNTTTSGDVYGLGVLIWELMTGHPPFRATTLPGLLREIAEAPVPSPGGDGEPVPPRDLESIARRALEKLPSGRYGSAADMAADLRCFLRGEPTVARPVSELGRFVRWCRRRPALAGAGLMTLSLLVLVAVGSTVAALRIRSAERQSREARLESERHLQQSRLAEAAAVREGRRLRFRARALELVAAATGPEETDEVRSQRRAEAAAALAFPEVARVLIPASPGPDWEPQATSDGLQYVAWKRRGTREWRVMDTWREGTHAAGEADGDARLLSGDGRWMAMTTGAATWELWDLRSTPPRQVRRHTGEPEDLSNDGRQVAWCEPRSDGGRDAVVAGAESGRATCRISFPVVNVKMRFSPEGDRCVMAPSSYLNWTNFPYSVRIYRTRDGALDRELSSGLANCIWSLCWGGNGRMVVAGERGGATYVWDAVTGRERHVFRGEGSDLWLAAVSPDGHRLATISADRLLQVRDLATGQLIGRSRAWLAQPAQAISWSARFPGLLGPVGLDDENVWVRVLPGAYRAVRAADAHGSALGLAVSPDGETVVAGDSRHARWVGGGRAGPGGGVRGGAVERLRRFRRTGAGCSAPARVAWGAGRSRRGVRTRVGVPVADDRGRARHAGPGSERPDDWSSTRRSSETWRCSWSRRGIRRHRRAGWCIPGPAR
jgi:hypothetical protein